MLYVELSSGLWPFSSYLVVSRIVTPTRGSVDRGVMDHVKGWTGHLASIELPRCIIVYVCVVSVITVSTWSSPLSMLLVLCISSMHGNSKITVMSVSFSPHMVDKVWWSVVSIHGDGGVSVRRYSVQVLLVAHIKRIGWSFSGGWAGVIPCSRPGPSPVPASQKDPSKDDHSKVSVTRGRYRTMERVHQPTPRLKISAGVGGDCDEGPVQAGTGGTSVLCLGCVNSQYVTDTWGQCKLGLSSTRNREGISPTRVPVGVTYVSDTQCNVLPGGVGHDLGSNLLPDGIGQVLDSVSCCPPQANPNDRNHCSETSVAPPSAPDTASHLGLFSTKPDGAGASRWRG